jgi:DNA polymerase delta subunit 2
MKLEHLLIIGSLTGALREEPKSLTQKAVKAAGDSEEYLNVTVLDSCLSVLTDLSNISVHIVPGEFDATNKALPQQPLHKSLLKDLNKTGKLHSCTNPCRLKLPFYGGEYHMDVMGHAGQPIKDIFSYFDTDADAVKLAELCLHWRHIAPTAPDTLCKAYF